ncbi:MAG: hypothetical protein P8Y24_13890 [Gammaproteobacteria bacterium]
MKKLILLIALSSLFPLSAYAESIQDFSYKMTYFYLEPNKDAFNNLQKSADKFKKELTKNGNGSDILISVLIARISQKHNWQIIDSAFSGRAKEILSGKTDLSKFINDDSKANPAKLDVWWASFSATGETKYLENIYKFASVELPKSGAREIMTVGAAKWSFKSNCRQHERVAKFAKSKLKALDKDNKETEFLKECIKQAEGKQSKSKGWVDKQGNRIPDKDHMKSIGDFGAQLIITDKEDEMFKNWGTPSETVYFPTTTTIQRNKLLTAVVVFSGCAIDKNGNCDLRMQMTVYQPSGKIYSKLPVMEVWSGKPRPENKMLGLSVDYMRLAIESHEPLGKYRIDAKVMDKISGDTMLLTTYFTAVEKK